MLRRIFLLLAFLAFSHSVIAQAPGGGAPNAAAPAPRVDPEQMRQEMSAIETALQREGLSDGELDRLRQRLAPVIAGTQTIIARETPRLQEVDERLAQIGAPPKDDQPAESPEVAKNRAEQTALKKEVDDNIRVAKLIQVRADQAATAITDYRRRIFTGELMHRTDSIASPWLWVDAMAAIPGAATDFVALINFRFRQAVNGLDRLNVIAALGLIFVLLAGYAPTRKMLLSRLDAWSDQKEGVPTRGQKALAAIRGTLVRSILPLIVALIISTALRMIGFGKDRLGEFLNVLLFSFAILAFLRGLLVGVLQPNRAAWRVALVEQRTVEILYPALWWVVLVVFLGKMVEAATQSISGALPITYAVKGSVAVLSAFILLGGLRKLDDHLELKEQALDEFGPAVGGGAGHSLAIVLKIVGWIAAGAVLVAALLGYIALAAFMTDQLVWFLAVGAFLSLLLVVVEEFVTKGTATESGLTRRTRAITGIAPQSIRQVGILTAGFIRLMIYLVGAMLVLASFGVNSGDLLGSMKAALFGFQVGGVTVSISKIVTSILLFVGVFLVFRGVQRWVEKTWLPATSLDAGLQNSIATIVGYIGFIVAIGIAMGYFGLSLDRIAILAGALSVGIGFGLQSIVNNFVSGLILLWERPIKVGDLIVVGAETGRVKRINVRSTEIQTADQASLIVPNSEFISGRVKNMMHANRIARIVIPISVAPGSDPQVIRASLLEATNSNMEVLSSPAPDVAFVNVTSTSLDFELRCFVDIDSQGPVRSDLMFDIFKRMKSLAVIVPPPKEPAGMGDIKTLMAALVERRRDPTD